MSLDQEYDVEMAATWQRLEEQLVAAANRGVVPANFQPTQCCLNSQTHNLRQPLAVMEGKTAEQRRCNWSPRDLHNLGQPSLVPREQLFSKTPLNNC